MKIVLINAGGAFAFHITKNGYLLKMVALFLSLVAGFNTFVMSGK